MESTPVNWEVLDSLVVDFAKSENLLVEDSPPSPSSSSSSYRSRLLVLQIRRSIESGDIQAAVDLLRCYAPALLDDHRILFRLHKQRFIELLRKGTDKDRDLAIECVRVSLAPCALNAYPEAYEEFKHVLLALIFDESDQTSPVASEWSEERRFDLAGLLSTILRAYLHAYDPVFPMALRYLISIHKAYCLRQGISSPISDLTDRLLFEDRDPSATPQESLFEAPPFDEVDIQALAHAVELTRQAAVDSLRFAKGDLFQAFQNELCRVRMNVSLLDEIVHDYCVYRGIADSCIKSPSATKLANGQSKDCLLNFDSRNSKLSDGEASVNNVDSECAGEANADSVSTQAIDVVMRFALETTNHREDCSTSDANHEQSCRRLRRSRYHSNRQRSRKRWRGRVVKWEVTPYASSSEMNKQDFMSVLDHSGCRLVQDQVSNNQSFLENLNGLEDNKYEILLEIKDLAEKGLAAEVFDELNVIDPDFFVQNPILFFQLKQVEFLKLVCDGNLAMALKVACTHLGPLAASNQSLLKPLKETLLALLSPSDAASTKGIPLSILATSLQVAMSRRLGIEEPQLMKIMRATLHTHNEWFKLQMCKDRFEEFLKIDLLKDVDAPVNNAMFKQYSDICTHGSSQSTICSSSKLPEDGSSPSPVSSSNEGLIDETAILKIMEFLALPRADAIHLLGQYNGNAETAIQQIFS